MHRIYVIRRLMESFFVTIKVAFSERGPLPCLMDKYRTHVPSRDFQLHFCQSLAGLFNEGSVDPGDLSHSHQLVPIQNQSKTGLAHWNMVAYIPSGLLFYMHEDPPHQKNDTLALWNFLSQ